jgi:hypothetical protein
MLKALTIVSAAVLALGFSRAVHPYQPDFDHVHGAFVCSYGTVAQLCRSKAGIFPVAWQRYMRND